LITHVNNINFCKIVMFLFSFKFCSIMCIYVLSSVLLSCPLRFPHKDDVRFVFTSSCLWEDACLIYIICVCLRVLVFSTYCVVFFFFFVLCTLCYHFLWDILFLIALSVFSNASLLLIPNYWSHFFFKIGYK
jgi:hypothetical protein